MDDFWDQNSESWIQVVRDQGIPSRAITSPALVETLVQQSARRILDVGCGEGWLAPAIRARLPQSDYLGIDGSPGLIRAAQAAYPEFRFTVLNYAALVSSSTQLEAEPFDAVVFNFSLFERDIENVLTAVKRELRKSSGRLVIQTLPPAHNISELRQEDFKTMSAPFHGKMDWYHLTRADWIKKLEHAGFTLESEQTPQHPETQAELSWILVARTT